MRARSAPTPAPHTHPIPPAAFDDRLGSLRTLGLISYPSQGFVRIEPWVFQ